MIASTIYPAFTSLRPILLRSDFVYCPSRLAPATSRKISVRKRPLVHMMRERSRALSWKSSDSLVTLSANCRVVKKRYQALFTAKTHTMRIRPNVTTMNGATPVFSSAIVAMIRPVLLGSFPSRITTIPPTKRTEQNGQPSRARSRGLFQDQLALLREKSSNSAHAIRGLL